MITEYTRLTAFASMLAIGSALDLITIPNVGAPGGYKKAVILYSDKFELKFSANSASAVGNSAGNIPLMNVLIGGAPKICDASSKFVSKE